MEYHTASGGKREYVKKEKRNKKAGWGGGSE